MKTCPFCKAHIEDEARFCLYCMTSLDKKEAIADPPMRHQRWLLWVAVAAFITVSLLGWQIGRSFSPTPSSPSASPSANTTAAVSKQLTANTTASTFDSASTVTSATTPSSVRSDTASYRYRDAQPGDLYSLHALIPADAIVITGVSKTSEDGIYEIPQTIDGKTVLAVMPHAFGDPSVCKTVNKVVFPSSLMNIRDYAFIGCNNLTDVYFRGDAVYLSDYAFPVPSDGLLTVHCSSTCHNRNFREYRNVEQWADGMTYQEWNGGELS